MEFYLVHTYADGWAAEKSRQKRTDLRLGLFCRWALDDVTGIDNQERVLPFLRKKRARHFHSVINNERKDQQLNNGTLPVDGAVRNLPRAGASNSASCPNISTARNLELLLSSSRSSSSDDTARFLLPVMARLLLFYWLLFFNRGLLAPSTVEGNADL